MHRDLRRADTPKLRDCCEDRLDQPVVAACVCEWNGNYAVALTDSGLLYWLHVRSRGTIGGWVGPMDVAAVVVRIRRGWQRKIEMCHRETGDLWEFVVSGRAADAFLLHLEEYATRNTPVRRPL